MTITPSTHPATRRARTAALLAALAGAVALAGMVMYGTGHPSGFLVMAGALCGVYWQVDRHLMLADLAAVDADTVQLLARPLPVLTSSRPEVLLAQLGRTSESGHALVRAGDEWRIISTAVAIDSALSADRRFEVGELGRRTRWVAGDTKTALLPRLPAHGEVWLVEGNEPPMTLTRDDLLGAGLLDSRVPCDLVGVNDQTITVDDAVPDGSSVREHTLSIHEGIA